MTSHVKWFIQTEQISLLDYIYVSDLTHPKLLKIALIQGFIFLKNKYCFEQPCFNQKINLITTTDEHSSDNILKAVRTSIKGKNLGKLLFQ